MENTITMIKVKSKSVIINGNIHGQFKEFCKNKSLKIGGVIENLILIYLNNPQQLQKIIDQFKENSH